MRKTERFFLEQFIEDLRVSRGFKVLLQTDQYFLIGVPREIIEIAALFGVKKEEVIILMKFPSKVRVSRRRFFDGTRRDKDLVAIPPHCILGCRRENPFCDGKNCKCFSARSN